MGRRSKVLHGELEGLTSEPKVACLKQTCRESACSEGRFKFFETQEMTWESILCRAIQHWDAGYRPKRVEPWCSRILPCLIYVADHAKSAFCPN